jgi:hypothetical protein
MSGEADLEEAIINELERQGCAYGGVDTGALAVALLSQECIQNSDSEVRNMQQSSDMVKRDCPHAAPFRYCETCKVEPCPIGLGGNVVLSLIDAIAVKLGYHRLIGSTYGVTARAALEACHHGELVEALEVLRVRECGSWCDPSLDEHTSYCRNGKALLAKIGGDA